VQKVSSWAEECEDDDDHRPSRPEFIELPTAPRAARIFDDDSIPYTGPFSARVSNLPFDTNEQDVDEFFMDRDIRIKEMRLARDEQNDRLRGYGHIEFETRDDLVAAIMLPDAMIRNRRIRIELAGDNDQRDGRAMRKRYDNYTPRDPTSGDSTNWRDRKESAFEPVERENRRGAGGGYQRSNFQNRHDNNNNNDDDGGNWRMGDRPNDSPPPERRRNNFGDRGDRDRRGGGRYERRDAPEEERPVLNLQPRTKPLPVLTFPKEEELERPVRKVSSVNGDAENHNDSGLPDDEDKEEKAPPAPKPKPVPSVNIFGQAKPVDTAARERQIEEKIDQEREAKVQRERDERDKQRAEAENAPEPEMKKDVIVIKTEKARQQEEAVNWRKHEEPSNEPADRNRDNGRRFDGDRRDRRGENRRRRFLCCLAGGKF
jgi:translation initiation factor 4B